MRYVMEGSAFSTFPSQSGQLRLSESCLWGTPTHARQDLQRMTAKTLYTLVQLPQPHQNNPAHHAIQVTCVNLPTYNTHSHVPVGTMLTESHIVHFSKVMNPCRQPSHTTGPSRSTALAVTLPQDLQRHALPTETECTKTTSTLH